MKFMLKTLGISLVLAIAGCANSGSNSNPSLSAADDAPACASSCASACKSQCSSAKASTCSESSAKSCCGKCGGDEKKPSLGAADEAPSCSQKSSCCPSSGKKMMPAAKKSSLGAMEKSKSDCGACPFSSKKN